jgi:hypothetical protein
MHQLTSNSSIVDNPSGDGEVVDAEVTDIPDIPDNPDK